MATQIVMDHTGDSRHHFNPRDAKSLLKAEQRFKELTGSGFTAAVRTRPAIAVTRVLIQPRKRRCFTHGWSAERCSRNFSHTARDRLRWLLTRGPRGARHLGVVLRTWAR